jgi:hypothetical protein
MQAGALLRGPPALGSKRKPRPDGAFDIMVEEVPGCAPGATPLANGGNALVRSRRELPGVTRVMVHPRCSVPALLARLGAPPGAVLEHKGVVLAHDPLGHLPSTLTEGAVLQLRPPCTDGIPVPEQRLPGCSVLPPRLVKSPEEAFAVVQRDGICILQLPDSDLANVRLASAQLPARIFGDTLAMTKAPVGVDDPSRLVKPHNDGANPYGDLFPDFIMLVCEKGAESGGESYMLDGHAMIQTMAPEVKRWFLETPLETKGFDKRAGKMTTWRSPALQRCVGTGRWRLRAPIDGAADGGPVLDQPCGEAESVVQGQAVISAWQEALLIAGPAAPRFKLRPGQALICDNYRIMHGREPHFGERLLWRCWVWTTNRLYAALPENCLCMCAPVGRVSARRLFEQGIVSDGAAPCPHCPQHDSLLKVQRLGKNKEAVPADWQSAPEPALTVP